MATYVKRAKAGKHTVSDELLGCGQFPKANRLCNGCGVWQCQDCFTSDSALCVSCQWEREQGKPRNERKWR